MGILTPPSPPCRYKFNIINLMKDDSLYSGGMLPLVHSERGMAAAGRGWHRSGQNVAYFSNSIRRGRRKRYSTLTFTLVAEHDHDLVHVAHCYPYTYTDLQRCGECEPTGGVSCVWGEGSVDVDVAAD